MSEELRLCPFCGPKGTVKHASGPLGYHQAVTCIHCGCLHHRGDWNTRPIEDALRAEITSMETRSRMCFCIWCGEAIVSYQGIASDLPAVELARIQDACRKHDGECVNNPFRADLARKDAEIAALDELVVQLENGLHLAQPYILPESRYWKQGIARSIAIQLRSARAKLAEVRGESKI